MSLMNKPRYKVDDIVQFGIGGKTLSGKIEIVDASGTFQQNDEPSYDIMVQEENTLYKHIRESWLIFDAETNE